MHPNYEACCSGGLGTQSNGCKRVLMAPVLKAFWTEEFSLKLEAEHICYSTKNAYPLSLSLQISLLLGKIPVSTMRYGG